MRPTEQYFKSRSIKSKQKLEQSHSILAKIGKIKESAFSLHPSFHKISQDHPENWNQYLPGSNYRQNNHHASNLSEDIRSEDYRISLQRKLERLLIEERQMLKERNMQNVSNLNIGLERSNKNLKGFGNDKSQKYNYDEMQRKIRQLEKKYHKNMQKQRQILKQISTQYHQEASNKENYIIQQKNREENQENLTHQVEKCILKEQALSGDIQLLKKQVRELHRSKEELQKKVLHREEKRKHKALTRQLLQSVLDQLTIIHAKIEKSKGMQFQGKTTESRKSNPLPDSLLKQFQQIQSQYRNFQAERQKAIQRQYRLQKEFQRLSLPQNQS